MYRCWVFEQHPKIDPDQPGNYIYATIENNQWVPVYIGQGDICPLQPSPPPGSVH